MCWAALWRLCGITRVVLRDAHMSQGAARNLTSTNKSGGNVQVNRIIQEIDAEITRLQQARSLLLGGVSTLKKNHVGRPAAGPKKAVKRKRRLSAEGRKRIADAMRKRWAERRKQQGTK